MNSYIKTIIIAVSVWFAVQTVIAGLIGQYLAWQVIMNGANFSYTPSQYAQLYGAQPISSGEPVKQAKRK
jgi:hypothetical protein